MNRARRIAFLGLAVVALPLPAQTTPPPPDLKVNRAPGYTWFRADFGDSLSDAPMFGSAGIASRGLIRHPMLVAPDTATLCWNNGRGTFIGRTDEAAATVDLVLRFPGADGSWSRQEYTLDLADAPAWVEADPQRAWAMAWHHDLRERASDVESDRGYYDYAARRVSAIYGLDHADDAGGRRAVMPPVPPDPTLYDMVVGGAAIQESLQLHRMLAADSRTEERTIAVDTIEGVTVPSHDYEALRQGREVVCSDLAALVPDDQYYLRFPSLRELFEATDLVEAWGPTLLRATDGVGFDYESRQRLLTQLCLIDDPRARMLGRPALRQVVITGCDPFVNSGGDVTILFEAEIRQLLEGILNMPWNRTRVEHRDAQRTFSDYRGLRIESLTTDDRTISCHRVWLDDVCVCSNSIDGVRRIIDVAQQERASLADAPDFQYYRASIYPLTEEEDAFAYLGDRFIRNLTSPRMRIGWNRRLEAATSLGLLRNAALFHAATTGDVPATLGAMSDSGALDINDLYDPEAGSFAWNPETFTPSSTTWNTLDHLTPLIELDVDRVTPREAESYEAFRSRYTAYWRDVFDPIGLRLTLGPEVLIETHVTPLIQNSWYEEQKGLMEGDPLAVQVERFSEDTFLRFVCRLNHGRRTRQALAWGEAMLGNHQALDWVGDWFTFWLGDRDAFEAVVREYLDAEAPEPAAFTDVFRMTLAAGAHVRNKLHLAAFLTSLKAAADTVAPNLVEFNRRDDHAGVGIVQIAPTPDSELNNFMDEGDEQNDDFTPALYYATIADGWYLTTREQALHTLIDHAAAEPASTDAPAIPANALLFVDTSAERGPRDVILLIAAQVARRQANANLEAVRILGECHLLDGDEPVSDVVRRVWGCTLACPQAGTYTWDAAHTRPVSSIYGHTDGLTTMPPLGEDAPLRRALEPLHQIIASMTFTDDDGLAAALRLRRDLPPEPDPPAGPRTGERPDPQRRLGGSR
ncbi:MAG: hypothetical protein KDA21_04160 [Phycisphaerales bacterium]|nr:hypothetical protein [Phycisphaerales bacterium]